MLALDGHDVAARDGVAGDEDGVVQHSLEIDHGRSGGDNFEVHGDGEGRLVALSAGIGHGVGGDGDGVAIGAGREALGIDGDSRGVRVQAADGI